MKFHRLVNTRFLVTTCCKLSDTISQFYWLKQFEIINLLKALYNSRGHFPNFAAKYKFQLNWKIDLHSFLNKEIVDFLSVYLIKYLQKRQYLQKNLILCNVVFKTKGPRNWIINWEYLISISDSVHLSKAKFSPSDQTQISLKYSNKRENERELKPWKMQRDDYFPSIARHTLPEYSLRHQPSKGTNLVKPLDTALTWNIRLKIGPRRCKIKKTELQTEGSAVYRQID